MAIIYTIHTEYDSKIRQIDKKASQINNEEATENGMRHFHTAKRTLRTNVTVGRATMKESHERLIGIKYLKITNDNVARKNTMATDNKDHTRRTFIFTFLGLGVEFSVTIS